MISARYVSIVIAQLVRIFVQRHVIQKFANMPSLKGARRIAKTYKVSGYIVDPNGDDLNLLDIPYLLETYGDVSPHFMKLCVTESPTWEFEDDCPENHGPLTDEVCERRFRKEETL